MKKIVYICSPFSMDRENMTNYARMICRAAADNGVVPYAPHLLFPQFMDDDFPRDRERALTMCFEMIRVVDELWAFGHIITNGMREEIEEAQRLGKTVRYFVTNQSFELVEMEVEK